MVSVDFLVILLDVFFVQEAKVNKIHQHQKWCNFKLCLSRPLSIEYRNLRYVEKRRNVPPLKVFVSEWDLTVEIPQTWHSAINNNSDQKCVAIPCNSVPHPERDIQFHWYCAIIGVVFFLPAPIPPCIECFSLISKMVQDSIWTSRC